MIWDALRKNYSDGGVNSVQPSAVCHDERVAFLSNTYHFCCGITLVSDPFSWLQRCGFGGYCIRGYTYVPPSIHEKVQRTMERRRGDRDCQCCREPKDSPFK